MADNRTLLVLVRGLCFRQGGRLKTFKCSEQTGRLGCEQLAGARDTAAESLPEQHRTLESIQTNVLAPAKQLGWHAHPFFHVVVQPQLAHWSEY
eukprot:3085347-Prymnesium_polylepis.1